jgi:biotin synthase
MLNSTIEKAYSVLETGVGIDEKTANELINLEGSDIMDLLSLANKVTRKFSNDIHSCSIVNAKSGVCRENCRFCAQSAHYDVDIETYDLLQPETILEKAKEAKAGGVDHFGIVTSGTGYKHDGEDFKQILKAIDMIKSNIPGMNVCASLGILDDKACKLLAERGIAHYNINLQVTPERFEDLIATTHPIEKKIETVKSLQKNGISVCCGGILGVGESLEDRVTLAFTLKELNVTVIPLNVLVAIKGTPLENQKPCTAAEVAKTFAVFRLINPTKIIKFAAGRETVMRDFQGLLMLSGANGMLTGGYLTTRGREMEDDRNFMSQLEDF